MRRIWVCNLDPTLVETGLAGLERQGALTGHLFIPAYTAATRPDFSHPTLKLSFLKAAMCSAMTMPTVDVRYHPRSRNIWELPKASSHRAGRSAWREDLKRRPGKGKGAAIINDRMATLKSIVWNEDRYRWPSDNTRRAATLGIMDMVIRSGVVATTRCSTVGKSFTPQLGVSAVIAFIPRPAPRRDLVQPRQRSCDRGSRERPR